MIPKGGRYAKSVVNFVRKAPDNWPKFKEAINQIDDLLKQGKLKLDGKQKTIFESNKNILKNHEKTLGKKEGVEGLFKKKKPEDYFKGWKPTVHERSSLRQVYKKIETPNVPYTPAMEKIDEELDALAFGADKYRKWSEADKATLFKKLQADMKKLIESGKETDLNTLSLGEINKKRHDLQKRIREIANDPNIKGDVYEGPKKDMIAAIYDSENPLLSLARTKAIKNKNLKKYGNKFPVLDSENNNFIVLGLTETGHPVKVSRFTGKSGATQDAKTGEWKPAEGTSWWDNWDITKNKIRNKGDEVWHETVNRDGKTIMSNPKYKLPDAPNMELNKELYSNLSTSELAKKGFKLKDIDMIVKGRLAKDYLTKNKSKDIDINMHEQTNTNEIMEIMEDLYTRGDDVYKMTIEQWTNVLPKYFARGGQVPGFVTGGVANLFRRR